MACGYSSAFLEGDLWLPKLTLSSKELLGQPEAATLQIPATLQIRGTAGPALLLLKLKGEDIRRSHLGPQNIQLLFLLKTSTSWTLWGQEKMSPVSLRVSHCFSKT